ncbi:MAG: phosphatidate cytidylyltransferase [Calditrichaeota bacterium]|nr:phosphatidate cytidylyltransferase [Calditrichota bacterium]
MNAGSDVASDQNFQENKSFWRETLRKTIHVTGLLIPVAYWYFPEFWSVFLLSAALLVAVVVEILRFRNQTFQKLFNRHLGFLLRPEEHASITGATYWIVGALITILIYPKDIAIFAISMLIVSDALAAWVGKGVGRIRIRSNKTLEGSLAFFLSAFLIARIMLHWSGPLAAAGALAGTVLEWGVFPLNDNLTVPIGSGLFLVLLKAVS